jgi:hypothetical protein
MFSTLVVLVYAKAFGSVILAMCFGSQATVNRKPGVPYFPGRWGSPNNILFRPHQLSDVGLRARRRCFICLVCFAVAFAFGLLLAIWHRSYYG